MISTLENVGVNVYYCFRKFIRIKRRCGLAVYYKCICFSMLQRYCIIPRVHYRILGMICPSVANPKRLIWWKTIPDSGTPNSIVDIFHGVQHQVYFISHLVSSFEQYARLVVSLSINQCYSLSQMSTLHGCSLSFPKTNTAYTRQLRTQSQLNAMIYQLLVRIAQSSGKIFKNETCTNTIFAHEKTKYRHAQVKRE